ASFLYGWIQRLQQRKLAGSSFRLPMARADLANHLGVAVETVSRSFSRLEQLGILQVSGKAVHIQDSTQLLLMANAQCA
ncbi:MAG: helix-turn-helix domain-containing protein, partial [Moraxellaceae bacterium]|nr:helix-turn-helix domain-containing protein [Moraxellaceae bacterium]